MDWFTKTCLVMIVLLLAVIAFRPMIFPQSAAAQERSKYVAVQPLNPTQPQRELDKYAADGWELAGAYMTNFNGINGAVLIFRK
jgi:hypothetical protein